MVVDLQFSTDYSLTDLSPVWEASQIKKQISGVKEEANANYNDLTG